MKNTTTSLNMLKTVKVLPPLLGLIAICFFYEPLRMSLGQIIAVLGQYDVEMVKSYILGFGIWAPVVSFGLMVVQSLIAPLPAFLITFANAALFGWIWGAVLSWSSAMAGAVLCFWLARLLGRDAVERLTSRLALDNVDLFFQRYGKYTIFIARLLPFVSFDVVSYGAGLTSMRLSSFVIATGIGQLPATLMYSYVGEMLTGGVKYCVFAIFMFFSCSAMVVLLKKIQLQGKASTITTKRISL